jgi:hypothetical protein
MLLAIFLVDNDSRCLVHEQWAHFDLSFQFGKRKPNRCPALSSIDYPSQPPGNPLDAGQQFHQVSDLDGFERTRGAVDLAAEALVETAGHELVEPLDRHFPCEGVGSEARVARPFVVPDCGLIQFRVPWSAYLASDGLTVGLDLLPESFGALL